MDWTRNITEDVNVTSIRKSYERASVWKKYSIIVIMANDTLSDPANLKWTKSVWRYYQHPDHGWVSKEHLFDSVAQDRVFYTYFDLFDDWAIGFKDDEFSVIFYKNFMGKEVPRNYEVRAYNQKYTNKDSNIKNYSFYDSSGYYGEWSMIVLVNFLGAQ